MWTANSFRVKDWHVDINCTANSNRFQALTVIFSATEIVGEIGDGKVKNVLRGPSPGGTDPCD